MSAVLEDLPDLTEFAVKPKRQTVGSSTPYDNFIEDSASRYGVDPDLVRAQIGQESTFKPNARSNKGAAGLMQLMPHTARQLGVKNIYDPKENIDGGVKYLKQQLDTFNGDVPLALAAYNAGPGAVQKHGGIPPFRETQNYVKRIGANYKGNGYHPSATTDLPDLSEFAVKDTPLPDLSSFAVNAPQQFSEEPISQQQFTDETKPVPETDATLQAQVHSANDPKTQRAAVLITDEAQNALFDNSHRFTPIPIDGKGTLWVQNDKAKKLKLRTPEDIKQFITANPDGMTRLIGKVENVGDNTGEGMAVHTVDPATGGELNSSIVTNHEAANAQIALDAKNHPKGQSAVVPVQHVIANRVAGHLANPVLPPTHTDSTISDENYDANGNVIQPPKPQEQMVSAKDSDNAAADIINIPKEIQGDAAKASEYVKSQLIAKYGVDPAKIAKTGFIDGYHPGNPIAVTYGDLKSWGVDTAPILSQKVAENRIENPEPDLTATKDYITEDVQTVKEHPDALLGAINPFLLALPDSAKQWIAPKLAGGIIGSGGRTADLLAGAIDIVPKGLGGVIDATDARKTASDFLKGVGETDRAFQDKSREGDNGLMSTIVQTVGGTPGDMSRLMLLSMLPGGIRTAMTLDAGLQSKGRGDSWDKVLEEGGKGLVIGSVFHYAPLTGDVVGTVANKEITPLVQKAIETGAIVAGTDITERVSGSKDQDRWHSDILNALFHLSSGVSGGKEGLKGKSVEVKGENGKTFTGVVDDKGNLHEGTLKGEPDIEMTLPKPNTAAAKHTPEQPLVEPKVAESKVAEPVKEKSENAKDISGDNKTYDDYQKAIDKYEDDLESQGIDTGKMLARNKADLANLPDGSTQMPKELADLYDKRDAIDKADVEANVKEIDKQFEALIPDATERSKFVRRIAQADLPTALRDENRRGLQTKVVGKLANAIMQHISPKYDRPETSFYVESVSAGDADNPSHIRLKLVSESGLAPSQETLNETQRWFDHLYGEGAVKIPGAKRIAKLESTAPPATTTEGAAKGEGNTVTTERGTKAKVEPKVIDASDILTSLDEGYPAELQPRDRSRAGSKAQISKIANTLDPTRLGDSTDAARGRPLVVPVEVDGKTKYAVVSGNGRVEAIRYAQSLENEPSKAYADFTQGKQKHDFKNPVYVGELKDVEDLPKFAKEANEGDLQQLSATEQAQVDAEHLGKGLLSKFVPNDDGSIHSGANRDFIRDFLHKAVPENEHNALVDENGQLSQNGVERIRNAVFAHVFGENAVKRLAETNSSNVKRITAGLLKVAPRFADLKEHIQNGTRTEGLDIASDIATALDKFSFLKDKGTLIDEYVTQQSLFGESHELTPIQRRLIQVMDKHNNSSKAISDILGNYIELTHELGDPKQSKLFGEPIERNADTVLREAVLQYEQGKSFGEKQTNLFDQATGRKIQPETSPAPAETKQSADSKTSESEADRKSEPFEAKPDKPQAESETKPKLKYGTESKLVTDDEAAKLADFVLKALGGEQTRQGSGLGSLDPEVAKALGKLAVYHFESSTRQFADFSTRMLKAAGEAVEPYLQELYDLVNDVRGSKEGKESNPTTTKHFTNDAEREALGLPPRIPPERKTDEANIAAAKAKLKAEPLAGHNLVAEILNNPNRAINDEENHLILTHKRQLLNDENKHSTTLRKAQKDGDIGAEASARLKLAPILDNLENTYKALDLTGAISARALRSRQTALAEDYSLVRLKMRRERALGREIAADSPEMDELRKESQAYKEKADALEKQLDEIENANARKEADRYFHAAIKQLQGQIGGKKASRIPGRDVIKQKANEARERMSASGTEMRSGATPQDIIDWTWIAADHIADGIDWIAEIPAEMAKKLKPHLKKIEEDARNIYEASIKKEKKEQTPDEIIAEARKNQIREIQGDNLLLSDEDALDAARQSNGEGLPDKHFVGALVDAHLRDGKRELDDVFNAVTDNVKELYPEATRRQVEDAYSDYGKVTMPSMDELVRAKAELRRAAQLHSAIADAEAGIPPKKTGTQRLKPTQTIREMQKELTAIMRKHGIETGRESDLASVNQARMTNLTNQIEDLNKQIETGEKPPKNVPVATTAEVDALKAERDKLVKERNEKYPDWNKKDPMSDERKNELRRSSIARKLTEYEERLRTGNFTKTPRAKTPDESATRQARNELAKIKGEIDRRQAKDDWKNRSKGEKAIDFWNKFRRAVVLTGYHTLAKLGAVAGGRMVTEPVEKLVESGVGAVLPHISKAMDRDYGFHVKAEAKAFTSFFTKGLKDAWETIRKGESEIDRVYGKPHLQPRTFLDFAGLVHAMEKAPVKRAVFERHFELGMRKVIADGGNPRDELTQFEVGTRAYTEANRAILMNSNLLTRGYQAGLRYFETKKNADGTPDLKAKSVGALLRTIMPIVSVPTNYATEVGSYVGGVPVGLAKIGWQTGRYLRGKEIQPEAANSAIRMATKGLVGVVAMGIGAANPEMFGGYYQGKRDEKDVKAMGIRIAGYDVPAWLSHNPLLEAMQFGATIRRVYDQAHPKTDSEKAQALANGLIASSFGLAQDIPFVNDMFQLNKLFDANTRPKAGGAYLANMFIPLGLQQAAVDIDRDKDWNLIERKPKNFVQSIEQRIPFLRSNVPTADSDKSPNELYRSGKLSKPDTEAALKAEWDSGKISTSAYKGAVDDLKLTNAQATAKDFNISKPEDVEQIDTFLKELPDDEKQSVFGILYGKHLAKVKDGSLKSSVEAESLMRVLEQQYPDQLKEIHGLESQMESLPKTHRTEAQDKIFYAARDRIDEITNNDKEHKKVILINDEEKAPSLGDKVRDKSLPLADAQKQLLEQFKAGAFSYKAYQTRLGDLKLTPSQHTAKALDAAKDEDFTEIETFLKSVPPEDRKSVKEIMQTKVDNKKVKTTSRSDGKTYTDTKTAADKARLQTIVNNWVKGWNKK